MCLSPILINNPTKYVSLKHGDPLKIQVPCGVCSECQELKSNEWLFRAMVESERVFKEDGFVYVDCLTYRPKDVPRLSRFFPEFRGLGVDHMCFDFNDVRLFFVRLRRELSRLGYDSDGNLKYFLSSEYGTESGRSHRPHYHLVLYVTFKISPLVLSRLVSKCWKFGRTDGVPYRSNFYVNNHNTICFGSDPSSKFRVVEYVTKYVQKDSAFESVINSRIERVVKHYVRNYNEYNNDMFGRRARQLRQFLSRCVKQFHRQSQGFGLSALENIDLNVLYRTGMVSFRVPSLSIVKHIPLPMYFCRKMFYDLIALDGKRVWCLNDLGKEYKYLRLLHVAHLTENKYKALISDMPSDLVSRVYSLLGSRSFEDLSHYVVFQRGRCFVGKVDGANVIDKIHEGGLLYNYCTLKDIDWYGKPFVSSVFLGNDVIGYDYPYGDNCCYDDVLDRYAYFDSIFEDVLSLLFEFSRCRSVSHQAVFDLKQRLRNVLKMFK